MFACKDVRFGPTHFLKIFLIKTDFSRNEYDASSTAELKRSRPSLGPSRFQPTPPIFENEGFDEYEFEIEKPKHTDFTDWSIDDLSEDENIVSQFANIRNDVDKTGYKSNTRPTDKSDWQKFD